MRSLRVLTVTAMAATGLVAAAPAATAAPACALTSAIGIPTMTVGGLANAGAVEVRTTCRSTPQLLTLPTPHAGDRFGASITDVYLSDTGTDHESLVVGVPGYDVGSLTDAGAVALFDDITTFSAVLTQGAGGVPGVAQAGARFGTSVSSDHADIEGGRSTVVIGEPYKDVGGVKDAGGYVTLSYDDHVLLPSSSETTLDTPGVAHIPLAGDLLGSVVNDTNGQVLAGAPGRQVDGHAGAGAVLFEPWASGQTLCTGSNQCPKTLITQDTACMPGVPEAGDHFGASLSDRWIGVPDEDLGSVRDAGMVERYDPAGTGHGSQCLQLDQDTAGMSGSPEAGDRFGAALGEFEQFDEDSPHFYYPTQLVIGVPGEDTGTHPNSGFANLVGELLTQETGGLSIRPGGSILGPGTTGAAFGTAFGKRGTALQISAPGAAVVGEYSQGRTTPTVTYRPSTSVPANSYGLALSNHDQ